MFRLIDRILDWAAERTIWVSLTFFSLGALLLLASIFIHGADLRFTGEILNAGNPVSVAVEGGGALNKNVSYAAAPNWGLYGILLLPLVIAFALRMRTERVVLLQNLATRGMIRDPDFRPIAANVILNRWNRDRRIHTVFLFVFAAVVILVAAWDWYGVVLGPTLDGFPPGGLRLSHPTYEFDWSIAHLMPGFQGSGAANLALGVFAYLIIAGVGCAIAFVVMIDATLFILFACGLTQSGEAMDADGVPLPRRWTIVPAPDREGDALCGFRLFSGFLSALLCASLAILAGLLLMVLQNSYLRDPGSDDIIQFVAKDFEAVAAGFGSLVKDTGAGLNMIFNSDKNLVFSNPQTIYAVMLIAVVAALSLGVTWLVLRKSAEAGRDVALENASQLSRELGLPEATIAERLRAMTFWPLGWVSFSQAMTMVGFMIIALLSLRLMLLPLVGVVAWLTARMIKNFAR
ncbi:hypothetical protein N0B44_22250 [Roseibacterium beibuensis]|uniref:hypothetical protein n=1 Tax=[Roseibacterium] beibuensis TaxID=1193142 RepID=UPI00217DF98D|nr:hypothetical protein [Roseibacterium beibuensis]MCS6625639.1 hypothetical protein [Roseibacterium beibuensis]